MTLTENSSVVTNDPQTAELDRTTGIVVGTQLHPRHDTKTTLVFLIAGREASCPYYYTVECNQKTPIHVSSRQHARSEEDKKGETISININD